MDLSTLPAYQHIRDKLQASWEEVLSSETLRVVLVEGPSGAYKTQTVEDFLCSSQVPWVSGYGSDVPDPYLLLRQIFESLAHLAPVQKALAQDPQELSADWKMALTSLAKLLPLLNLTTVPAWEALSHWQPPIASESLAAGNLESEQLQPATLPGLLTLALGELAAQFPFVLLIEDLDQANMATLEALTMDILPSLQNSHILVIATFIPEDREPVGALSHFLQTALDIPETRHLKLSLLDEQAIARILSARIPGLSDECLASLAQQVHISSHGIPARVQDLMIWLQALEMDLLTSSVEVPAHSQFIQAQFAALPEKLQDFLQVASVQGLYFCLESVIIISKGTSQTGADMLADDTAAFFVRLDATATVQEKELHWYHFRGKHIRDWIYNAIPDTRRTQLHSDTALALEHIYDAELDLIVGRLAEHLEKAGIQPRAALYFARVACQANAQGATMEALAYARRGLKNLEETAGKQSEVKCRLLLEQGCALKGTEESHRAEDILREALELAEAAQDSQLEMEVKHHLGKVLLRRNVWDEGLDFLEQAIDLATEQRNWRFIVESMEYLRSPYRKRDPNIFLALCDRLIAMMEKMPSSEAALAIAELLENKGWVLYEQRKHSQALDVLEQAFHYLNGLGDLGQYPHINYKIHLVRTRILRLQKKYLASLKEANKAITWAYASHSRKNIAWAHDAKATTLRRMGPEYIEEAEREHKMILRLFRSSSDLATLAVMEASYGVFLAHSGREKQAKELYIQSYKHRLVINDLQGLQSSRNNIAAIDWHLGAFQSALTEFQQLFTEGLTQEDRSRQNRSLNYIGDIYRILNCLDKAEQTHFQAISLSEQFDSPGQRFISMLSLGQVYLCGWQLNKARNMLRKAEVLSQKKAVFSINLCQKNEIYLARLALYEGNRVESYRRLKGVLDELDSVQELVSIGIGYINFGLVELTFSQPENALTAAKRALEALAPTESWRITEAHHLLARCHLALGELEHAQSEIEQAKHGFMDLGLFHRVYQAESTELHIQEAQESGNWDRWQTLSHEELRDDFNHLGI